MASLTVRQLDEILKKLWRLHVANGGRSADDEGRTILREAAEQTGHEALELINPPAHARPGARTVRPAIPAGTKRVLLIIGGGIAAYKSLDLIRRLKERGIAVR